ncbi:MAG: protein kinase domain-containing protein [Thermoanaerobaculia bacterium]
MPLQSGSLVGPYEVVAPLGAGGMGEVYRARDPRIGREVAIKVLPAGCASSSDRLARFAQEAKSTGALNHPNILVVFDLGTHEDSPYLVTELLEGETLRQRLERDSVPIRKAIDWATQIAEGASAAHEKGVIHRDIKPENVFLTRDERVKLLDFGLAKLIAGDAQPGTDSATHLRHTDPGSVLGTPGYMAPEQVRGEAVDERADIFALGIVLTEMATGSHPFHRATRVETMTAILQSDVALPDSIPPGLARIIDHLLAKHAGSRFQSMKDVAFALRLLSGSHASGELSSSTRFPPVRDAAPAERDFLSITRRRGRIGNARFTPDGTVLYGAAWEGNALETYLAHPGKLEALPLGISGTDVLSVSSTGELAVSLGRTFLGGWTSIGTLARMRMAGSAPRKIQERVVDADWAPDGKSLAIIRQGDAGTFVLEYPIGRQLRVSAGWLSHVRFSRDGSRLAFIDHPWFGDDAGRPVVIDLEGRPIMTPEAMNPSTSGLAWSPEGDEVWIAGDRAAFGRDILGYDMSGKGRLVFSAPGQLTLCDVSPGGKLLITHDNWRREVYTAMRGEVAQKNLAWFEWPMLTAISNDGTQLLFEEQRARSADSEGSAFFLRPVDGGPAVHIGNGRARAISADGNWVAADTGVAGHLELIPTGIGESKFVKIDQFAQTSWWWWFPDGKRLLVWGQTRDNARLSLCVPIDGSEPTPAGPGNLGWPAALSPDGERVVSSGAGDRLMIYPIAGGEETPLLGTEPGEWPFCWSDDGKYVYVYPRGKPSVSIDRIEIATGERVMWQELHPVDGAGIVDIFPAWITPDGQRYAYSYRRCLSDLYLVEKTPPNG